MEIRAGSPADSFSVEVEGNLVRLVGELDVAGVGKARAALVPNGNGDLLVDCAALTFLDAAGLGVLVAARRTCQAAGVDLVLLDPGRCVTWLMQLTDLEQHFSVRRTG